jgi:hypothetical protein
MSDRWLKVLLVVLQLLILVGTVLVVLWTIDDPSLENVLACGVCFVAVGWPPAIRWVRARRRRDGAVRNSRKKARCRTW